MPDLGKGKRGIDLSQTRAARANRSPGSRSGKGGGKTTAQKKAQVSDQRINAERMAGKNSTGKGSILEDDTEDEEDEEILGASDSAGKGNSMFKIAGIIAVPVVIIIAVVFMINVLRGRQAVSPGAGDTNPPVESGSTETQAPVETNDPNAIPSLPVGMQDFTGDTTMESSSTPEDPANFTKDINGLTTQVNYTVDRIYDAADFVSYEKHRGTWNAGLELYWLEAEYRGKKYTIQVPFKYYKELDDIGIIPVKMEVLSIKSDIDGSALTVVSYMCLDEKVLEQIQKTQK